MLALVIASSFSITKAQEAQDMATKMLKERGEVYFKINNVGVKEIMDLSAIISIDNVENETVFAYANTKMFESFLDLGLDYEVLTPPSLLHKAKMKDAVNVKEILDWDFYPTYEAYVDMMYQFATDYPDLCQVFSIGQTTNGRELLFARISDNVGVEEGEAQFLYTGTMHGDETTGFVLFLRLIDYLLSNYGTDDEVTNLVQNLDIWINPAANPDGTYAGGNSTVNGAQRYNANFVDLNRNYPDPEDGPHPDGEEWQPETIAFMNLAESNHFVMAANTHGGAEVVNYPWDTWPQLHADDEWWQYVSHEFADTAQFYSPSGYLSGFNDGITNGYQWYTTNGNRQDYMNYFHQCREFILEISDTKLLPASQLPAHWEYLYRSFLNYMGQALFGVSGSVTDASTGEPLEAQVFIENHDMDSSMVFSVGETGKYFRPLFTGTYDITFSAIGHYPVTIEDVSVQNYDLTILDVELDGGDLICDFTASQTNIPIGTAINFTDLSFGSPVSWEWTFEGASPETSNEQNPTGILYSEEGTFDVSLTISDGTNTTTINKEDYISVSVEFIIQNTTVTTCTGVFYDTGGANGDYSDNQDFTMTFLPATAGSNIMVEFTSFNVEFESSCDYDWLKIYDGASTSASLIGKFCGTNSPGTITATNAEGALTFEFHSDQSVTESGWSANIACDGVILPPVADFTANVTDIMEGESVVFSDMSANEPTQWAWTFEGGTPLNSTEQNPEIVYSTPGTYDVLLIVSNDEGSNTILKQDFITVHSLTGLNENLETRVRVYPNPTKNFVNIESPVVMNSVTLMNILGEQVYRINANSKNVRLQTSDLIEGIYFIQMETGSGIISKKIQVIK